MDSLSNRFFIQQFLPQPLCEAWSKKKTKTVVADQRDVLDTYMSLEHPITSFSSLHTLLVPPMGIPIFTPHLILKFLIWRHSRLFTVLFFLRLLG